MNTVKKSSKLSFAIVLLLMLMPLLGHAAVAPPYGECPGCDGNIFWSPPEENPPPLDNGNPDWGAWEPFTPGPDTYFRIGNTSDHLSIYFGIDNEYDPRFYKNVWLVIEPIKMNHDHHGELKDKDILFYLWVEGSYRQGTDRMYTTEFLDDLIKLTDDGNIRIDWRITPCPEWEWIKIRTDQVIDFEFRVVDFGANCVPEPATLSLVGLGIAGLAARRYRQRNK